jgi:hypothetical protein
MRADGRDQVRLTNNTVFDAAPDWQPLEDDDDHDDGDDDDHDDGDD